MARCGLLWVVVAHCGLLWLVVGGCGSLLALTPICNIIVTRILLVIVFGCLSIYYKMVLKSRSSFCDCFIVTLYEVMEFISNTLTSKWTYSVGLIFVFKATCFNWEFMCANPNFRDLLA